MKAHLVGINSKYIHPAMGIFQLVANSLYEVTYQESLIKDDVDKIVSKILTYQFDLIGFSCYIWNIDIICSVIKKLKSINISCPIFVGGPESYFKSDYLIKQIGVDYVINGEGEESFNELMDYLSNKISINNVSNLYYLEDNEIRYTFDKIPNIDNIKHDYSLIKDFKNRVVYLESSRGCYFKCSYCIASLEKRVRFFKIDQVEKDILFLLKNNAKTIKFLDRSFNVNKEYMLQILKFINRYDNNVTTFQFEIVGDMLDKEVIDYINSSMRKGYLRFEIGIQSTNNITTKSVFRKQNFKKLKENIIALREVVTIHTDLIAGLPYENLSSFIHTFNETYLLMTDELQLGFLKELKGTYISNHKDDHNYQFSNQPPYEIIDNKYITKEELSIIHLVEEGLEKYHNKGDFKRTMNYLFLECHLDPFETFKKLYLYNNSSFINKQHDEISKNLFLCLKDEPNIDSNKLLYIIKQDYLSKFNVRPKIWWNQDQDRQERNELYKRFISKYPYLNINDLYTHSKVEKYLNNAFVVLFYGYKNEIIFI